jgi:uncharacterized protein YndB with AHSA1/START domain
MYHVFRQTLVPGSLLETWKALTTPSKISMWFADNERMEPGERFEFRFGDGDYFAGTVIELAEPSYVHLQWRFMDLGPRFDIRYYLTPLADATEVTVHDFGSLSVDEVMSLRQGWEDFLMRLAQFVETGERVRYLWSDSISIGAILRNAAGGWPAEFDDPAWWHSHFPEAKIGAKQDGENRRILGFLENGWSDIRTEALLETGPHASGTYVSLVHRGWPQLPEARQVAERKRYADIWQGALAALEQRYA